MAPLPRNRPPVHPGRVLMEDYLEPLEMTQAAFSKAIDVSYPRLNELIKGKRGVTPSTALRLAHALGTTPQYWMNLQAAFDLWHSRQEEAEALALIAMVERPRRKARA